MASVKLLNTRNQAVIRPFRNSVKLRLVQVKTTYFFISAHMVVSEHMEVR